VLESGRWYQITQRIKMNDPSVGNGVIQMWLDGELVHDEQNMIFRHTDTLKIDLMYFSTFFGGNEDWATSKDETVYFDDFVISTPNSRYLKVPQNYSSIQTAIDAALPGDIVAVRETQIENVIVDKPITLRGYNGTKLIAADSTEPAITVAFAGSRVFRIVVCGGSAGLQVLENRENVNVEFVDPDGAEIGIHVQDNCHNSKVFKCDAYDNLFEGILITGSNDITVRSNRAFSNGHHGISVRNSVGADFARNRSQYNGGDGIFIDASGFEICNNRSNFNEGYGLLVKQNGHTVIINKAVRNQKGGFDFRNSSDCQCVANVARRNEHSGYFWRTDSMNNLITSNTSIHNRKHGFVVSGSSGNFLSFGTASDNLKYGYLLTSTSSNNNVSDNHAEDNGVSPLKDNGTGNVFAGNDFND